MKRIARWVAYTEILRQALLEKNVSDARIVVVNKTLTVSKQLEESDVQRHKSRFVYIGGLHKEKRLDLIFETIERLHNDLPEVELPIAGTCPDQMKVEEFANEHF